MRLAMLTTLALLFSGCATVDDSPSGSFSDCATPQLFTLFLTEDLGLAYAADAGSAPGNGFVEAFLTNDIAEFTGGFDLLLQGAQPEQPIRWAIEGDITIDLWVQSGISVAPIVSTSDPTTGYHFFNQFGTTQGFAQGYSIIYDDTITTGETYHFTDTWNLTSHYVEPGDDLRLLLTNLVLDDASGEGPIILVGPETPSAVSFTARCEPLPMLGEQTSEIFAIALPLNQGLLTGAIPANAANQAIVNVNFQGIQKMQVKLEATNGDVVKDDVDLTFLDSDGNAVYSGGSPYTNEIATLWADHLELFPGGEMQIQVDGYSSINYEGTLTVTAW